VLPVKLALPARLVQPAPRAHKASKDPSDPRAPSASAGWLALPERPDRSDRRARRVKPVAKAQSDPAANVDRQDRRAPLAQPDRRARRVTRARHRQFASSPVRIAFAAETTKSWLVLFARAVRPTERSARRPARHQPVYVHVDDLGHRVATSSTFSNSTMRWGNRVETRFADNELACAPKRPSEHRPRTSGAPISSHTPTPGFSYSLTLLRLRCFGSWRGFSFAWAAGWRQGSGSPPRFQSGSRKTGWPRGLSGNATRSCGATGSFAPCDVLPRQLEPLNPYACASIRDGSQRGSARTLLYLTDCSAR